MALQGFLIADLETGLFLAREPWQTPENAWRVLRNAHIFRGRLRKRPGYRVLDTPGTSVVVDDAHAASSTNITGTLANTPVKPSDVGTIPTSLYAVRFTDAAGSQEIYDDGAGNLIGDIDAGGTNTINYATGAYDATFAVATTDPVDITYEYLRGLPIMGIESFVAPDNSEYFFVFDTRRIYRWNATEQRFYDEVGADTWSGGDSDFFDATPFGYILVINNGVNAPRKFDPAGSPTVDLMDVDYDNDSSDDIDSAAFFRRDHNRGLYFSTVENSATFPGRVRLTNPNNPESWRYAADYIDVPTNDVIIDGAFAGDALVVGLSDSIWALDYLADSRAPYGWRRLPSKNGVVSKNGMVPLSELLFARSDVGFIVIDASGQREADLLIPDLTLGWNPQAANYTQGERFDFGRQVWWTYADAGEDTPQHLMVMQYNDEFAPKSWSIYDIPFHSLGRFENRVDPIWDDLTQNLDDIEWALDDPALQTGFPLMIGGTASGVVYEFGPGGVYDDAGTAVSMIARSGRLQPFPRVRNHLSHLEFVADASAGESITFRFYADYQATPYKTATIPLDASGSSDKVRRRVRINRIAHFHTFEMEVNNSKAFNLDAVELFVEPAGPARDIG